MQRSKENRTVLVIDDDPALREMGRCVLEALGWTVLTAEDGPKGLEIFRANSQDVDAVLLDLTMPGMNGVETFHELVRMRHDLPVVLTSGCDEWEISSLLHGHPSLNFVSKPFRIDTLRTALQHSLGTVTG